MYRNYSLSRVSKTKTKTKTIVEQHYDLTKKRNTIMIFFRREGIFRGKSNLTPTLLKIQKHLSDLKSF